MSNPNVSAESVIQTFFEQFIDQWGSSGSSPFKDNQGGVFTIQINHEHFGYEEDGNTHHEEWAGRCIRYCHIIITAGKNVFYASEYDEDGRSIMDWNKIPVDKWFNTSNHSSCWRSDGFRELHKHDFEAYKIAHQNVPEEVRPCYNHSHKHNRLGHGICTHKLVKFVEVQHSAVDPSNSYHRKIDSIKELKVKMVIIDEENDK